MWNERGYWQKKPIDRMEMLHLLGVIYGRTGGRFEKVGLRALIQAQGKPTVKPKVNFIIKALVRTEMLLVQGEQGRSRAYKWNLQKFGPVTLALADRMILETAEQVRIRAREYRQNLRAKC